VTKEREDNRAEELLLDSLIGEAYRDKDILEELMTVQEVLDSIQKLLAYQKQLYAPRSFSDLSLLKQYTAQMLKKGEYYLDKFTVSKLVAQSNYVENNCYRARALSCDMGALGLLGRTAHPFNSLRFFYLCSSLCILSTNIGLY
jgi:hypothetical protein